MAGQSGQPPCVDDVMQNLIGRIPELAVDLQFITDCPAGGWVVVAENPHVGGTDNPLYWQPFAVATYLTVLVCLCGCRKNWLTPVSPLK